MRARALAAAALAASLSACAYFNALYNAKRFYGDARRSEAKGDVVAARTAYDSAVAKAARSFVKDSTGRWSNDALLLVARSYFGMARYDSARTVLQHLLARDVAGDERAGAQAYLGAVLVSTGKAAAAIPPLDSAAARLDAGSEMGRFGLLWRGRARMAAGDTAGGWADLAQAAAKGGPLALDAELEMAVRSLDSPGHATAAFEALATDASAARAADSIRAIGERAVERWGPARVRELLTPVDRAPWPSPVRAELRLYRAELAAGGGDTAQALDEVLDVAQAADRQTADRARVEAARWQLAGAVDLAGAAAARTTLLPAIEDPEAQQLIHALKVLDVLLAHARDDGQPLALFAAAELARDELRAPALARKLFLTYVDVVPQATWAPKALLAASLVAPPALRDSLRARMAGYDSNVYVAALAGRDSADAFADAETRLSRSLAALRDDAGREAEQKDAGVVRAVAVLDSVKSAAQADSTKLACGTMVDSLALKGARADSVRVSCVEGDTARVAYWLKQKDVPSAQDTLKKATTPQPGRGLPADTIR